MPAVTHEIDEYSVQVWANDLRGSVSLVFPVFPTKDGPMKIAAILAILVLVVVPPTNAGEVPPIDRVDGVYLTLEIRAPHESNFYPQHEVTWESYPLILEFHLQQDTVPPPDFARLEDPCDLPLYELYYDVTAAYGENAQYEDEPFFADRIDLYGKMGPGSVRVSPGVYIPPDAVKIRIDAKLNYKAIVGAGDSANQDRVRVGTLEVDVHSYPEDRVYHRYRDGYLRRHLLESGRGLSWVWLKEYEPGKDRKELIYHSRTFKAPGDRTRVYVPWVYEYDSAHAVHGGDENPLLRGGLAMATFSLEYIAEWNPASLSYALKLFEYVEKSEWIYPNGTPSGFFLRSKWPGSECQETGTSYCYASIDEIAGMLLGLYYLNMALTYAIEKDHEADYFREMHGRLVSLVDRLGVQLSSNYYFIIPPVGLPQERQTGWSGGYVFEWFLSNGIRAIAFPTTGRTYKSPAVLEKDWPQWRSKPSACGCIGGDSISFRPCLLPKVSTYPNSNITTFLCCFTPFSWAWLTG